MEKRKSVTYVNLLNVMACMCVIGMHCNGLAHTLDGSTAWKRSFCVEVLAYWAVPIFFMLPGVTMMNYRDRYSTGTFLGRRLKRVGLPLLFWTVVFYAWFLHEGVHVWAGFRDIINRIVSFQIVGTYWFFGPLLMLHLSMPVLSKLRGDLKLIKYTIIIGVTTVSLLPFLFNLMGLKYNKDLCFPVTGGYIFYPLIGYYLHETELKTWQQYVIYILGILGAVVRYFHTSWTLYNYGIASMLTWGYTNVPVLLMAVAIFLFAKNICKTGFFQNEKVQKGLQWLSGASFGIYLIHVFVMNFIAGKLGIRPSNWLWQWFGALLVYGVCILIVKSLQKTPIGKYIIP